MSPFKQPALPASRRKPKPTASHATPIANVGNKAAEDHQSAADSTESSASENGIQPGSAHKDDFFAFRGLNWGSSQRGAFQTASAGSASQEAESRSQAQADEGLPTASIQKNSEKRKRGTSSVIQPISAIIAEVSDDETDQENTRTRKRSRSGSIAQKSFASTSHLGNNLPATPQDRQTALSNVFQDDDNEPTLGVFGSARAEWGRSRLQKSHTSGTTHTSSNDEISTSASAQDPSASTGPASTNHSSPRQQAENTETFFQGADKHTDAATGRGRQDVRARHLNEPSRIYGSLSTQQGHNSRSTREESVSQPNSYQFPSAQSVHSERGARNPSSDPIQHLAQKRIDRDLHIVLQDSSSDYDPEERIKRESPALQPVTYGEGRINAEGAPDVEERSTGERSQWQRQASKAGDHADKRGQAMGLEDWIKGGQEVLERLGGLQAKLVQHMRTKVARYAELKDKFEKHEKILHERRQKLDKRAERFRLCTARALEMTNDEEGQTYPARSQHEVMQLSSDRETTSMMRDLSDQRASSSPKAGGQFQSHEESHEEQEQEPGQGHDSQQHDDADRVQQATEHNSAPTRQANTVERVDTMQQHQEDGMAVGEGDESGAEKSGENQQEEGGVEPSVQDQEETDIRRGDAYGDDAASRNEAASAAVAAAS